MPTIFTHPAVPLALGLGLGRERIPAALLFMGAVFSSAPDLDCISFILRIPYESDYGHRGFAHSLVFAALLAALGAFTVFRDMKARAFWFLFASAGSHGLLDTLTNGGHGIALLWPFTGERYFAPAQVIQVSPIGKGFFSLQGVSVILSEILWVWLPCAGLAALMRLGGRLLRQAKARAAG